MKPIFTPWAAAALTVLALSFGVGAQAAVLTFDTLGFDESDPHAEAGYLMGPGPGAARPLVFGSAGGGVGLDIYLSAFPTVLSLTRADGGAFALRRLDIVATGFTGLYDEDDPQDDVFFEGWRRGVKVAEAAGSAEAASTMSESRMGMTFADGFGVIDEVLIFGRISLNREDSFQATAGIDNIFVEAVSASARVPHVPLPAPGLALAGGLALLLGAVRTRRGRATRV